MEDREKQLCELRSYIGRVEKDITLALQTLQWDRRRLMEDSDSLRMKAGASADPRPKLPAGYESDILLPDGITSDTLVRFSPADVASIIKAAARSDSSFKMGEGEPGLRSPAQSAGRLQCTYTPDERRALYDATVARAPLLASLHDLTLPGDSGEQRETKSWLQVMSELRDMKRRRPKYKVAAKSKNYSVVLREIISNQMELYTGIKKVKETSDISNHASTSAPVANEIHHNMEFKQERSSHSRDISESHDYDSNDFKCKGYYKSRACESSRNEKSDYKADKVGSGCKVYPKSSDRDRVIEKIWNNSDYSERRSRDRLHHEKHLNRDKNKSMDYCSRDRSSDYRERRSRERSHREKHSYQDKNRSRNSCSRDRSSDYSERRSQERSHREKHSHRDKYRSSDSRSRHHKNRTNHTHGRRLELRDIKIEQD